MAALLAFALTMPSAFPRAVLPALRLWTRWSSPDLRLERADVSASELRFEITSSRLRRFPYARGESAPDLGMRGSFRVSALNLYPIIAGTILFAVPMTGRRRAAVLGVAAAALTMAAAADLWVLVRWVEAEGFAGQWPAEAPRVLLTPDAQKLIASMQREMGRIAAAKDFLAAGGRLFIAVLTAAAGCLLAGRGVSTTERTPPPPEP